MALCCMKELIEQATHENRAVGAFSVGSMEMVFGRHTGGRRNEHPHYSANCTGALKAFPFAFNGTHDGQRGKGLQAAHCGAF